MKNVPDDFLRQVRGRPGDLPSPSGGRWGKVLLLHTDTLNGQPPRTSVTFIDTELLPQITPMAVSLRFSLDGQTFTPAVPSAFGGTLRVQLIEAVDMKAGPFVESFTLEADDVQPFCGIICRALSLSVNLEGENQQIWVQAVAAPTTSIDCADVIGPPSTTTTIRPMTDGSATRVAAVAAVTTLVPANPDRGLFSIVNQSNVNLFVRLGDGVDVTPGSELATIVLPASVVGGWEVANYTGVISFAFDGSDAGGYALYTEGVY